MRGRKRNVGRPDQADPDQDTGTARKNGEIIHNKSTRCHLCARQGDEMFLDELILGGGGGRVNIFWSIERLIFDFILHREGR